MAKSAIRFTASWDTIGASLAENVTTADSELSVSVVDIDENSATAETYNVTQIPTFVLLEDGVEVNRFVGMKSIPEINDWLNG